MIQPSHTFPAALTLVLAMLAAQPAAGQTTAPGPYYALPSWDMTLPSATRFIVLSNMNSAAVLDRETGLVWDRHPSAATSWENADALCRDADTGGRKGWRLPTIEELLTLFDPARSDPALPLGHPFVLILPLHLMVGAFSQTPAPGSTLTVRAASISTGETFVANKQNPLATTFAAGWCVRGPQR